ncbi:methyltransferase domain-containing protein [Acidianus brierleyi]|uniref:methyltransferase domain-containing protein n=1 Tax=Acidianus brierleyi TaxID=41673 RepID=UPI001FE6C9BF|nr:methyltransferase domain-containing protein [Acidianus brierleyi]
MSYHNRKIFPFLDDEIFENLDIPGPTKQEIRVISISKMNIFPGCKTLEIGTGTGSVSAELDRLGCYVISIDKNKYIEKISHFNNVEYIQAHSAFMSYRNSIFDNVFIGGTENLEDSIKLAHQTLKYGGKIVINIFTLETLSKIQELVSSIFHNFNVLEVIIIKGKNIKNHTMFLAQNPIYIAYAVKS